MHFISLFMEIAVVLADCKNLESETGRTLRESVGWKIGNEKISSVGFPRRKHVNKKCFTIMRLTAAEWIELTSKSGYTENR